MEIRFELLPLPNYYTAPAHPNATDVAVYTALFVQYVYHRIIYKYPQKYFTYLHFRFLLICSIA